MSASREARAAFLAPPHNAQSVGGVGWEAVGPLLALSASFIVLFAHTQPRGANAAFAA